MDSNRLVPLVVTLIHAAFDSYQALFAAVTARAKENFERRDWAAAQRDAARRLALYRRQVDEAVTEVRALLGAAVDDVAVWAAAKAEYADLASGRDETELAETFFNSVTRRVFGTVGANPAIEFVSPRPHPIPPPGAAPVYRTFRASGGTAALVQRALLTFDWAPGYADVARDAGRVAAVVDAAVARAWGPAAYQSVDVLAAPFFRNKGAYLVARVNGLSGNEAPIPLVLPLLNDGPGVRVDAALTTSDEASVVFGFTWSYFHVEAPRPRALVDFLRSVMPQKRVDELYNAIGLNKHGKTELYRTLLEHLEAPGATFERAEGDEGLVMSVFTLPSLNVVFKIIKDVFGPSKRTTRREVMEKYQLVFARDRVGRLADAQEFEDLAFRRECFAEPLLEYLRAVAGRSVRVDGDRVVVTHLYTERRVTPLNLFLRDAEPEVARDVVLDYGTAIKDLAAANIFPGDMLLKNFGVTRHGRVIFYDYDELCLLTDCHFRRMPQARAMEDELSDEPWFYVGERDVFPEEFQAFMLPAGELRTAFLAEHADLLEVEFWQEMQGRQKDGELLDVFPYRPARRFPRG